MAATERQVFESIYKVSTEGHERVIADIDDIHKSILNLSKDLAFKPIGFHTISVEAEKAKKSIEDVAAALGSIPKEIAGLKGGFKDISKNLKVSIQLDAAQQSKNIQRGLERGVEDAKKLMEKETFDTTVHAKFVEAQTLTEAADELVQKSKQGGKEFHDQMVEARDKVLKLFKRFDEGLLIGMDTKAALDLTDRMDDVVVGMKKEFNRGSDKLKKSISGSLAKGFKGFRTGSSKLYSAFENIKNPTALLDGLGDFGETLVNWSKKSSNLAGKAGASKVAKGAAGAPGGAAAGATGGEAAMLGKAAAAIGTIAMAVGAIVVLVKVILDADAAITDLNKSIFDNIAAGNLVTDTFGKTISVSKSFQDRLEALQDAATDTGFYLKTGVKAEEFVAAIGSMNKAGLMFTDMIGEAGTTTEESSKRLQIAVEQANRVARNFGVSLTESSDTIADWRRNLLMSSDDINKTFLLMQQSAGESRQDLTKMFNVVKDVSADFVLFGVRTQEVVGMLDMLGKTVGPKKAAELLGGLTKNMKDMTDQDRIRMVALAGTAKTQDALTRSQDRSRKEMDAYAKTLGKGIETDTDYQNALKGDAKAHNNLIARFKDTAGFDDLNKKMMGFVEQSKEMKSGMVGLANAVATTDLTAQLEVQMGAVEGLVGPIAKATGIQAMVARQQLGYSMEQWKAMQRIDATLISSYEAAQATAAKRTAAEVKAGQATEDYIMVGKELMKRTQDGTYVTAKKQDFMTKELGDQVKGLGEQKSIGEQQVSATRTMTDILEVGFKNLMRDLGQLVQKVTRIIKVMGGASAKDTAGEELATALKEQRIMAQGDSAALADLTQQEADLKNILSTMPEDASKQQVQLAVLGKLLERGAIESKDFEKALRGSGSLSAKDWGNFSKEMTRLETARAKGPEEFKKVFDELKTSTFQSLDISDMSKMMTGITTGQTKLFKAEIEKTFSDGEITAGPQSFEKYDFSSPLPKSNVADKKDKKTAKTQEELKQEAEAQTKALDFLNSKGIKFSPAAGDTLGKEILENMTKAMLVTELMKRYGDDYEKEMKGTNVNNLTDLLDKFNKPTAKLPAESPKNDFLVSKAGYVKLSAGDIAFNPSEAARGMATKAGGLAGTAINRLAASGAPTAPTGASANVTRNQSNVFNINGGNIQEVRRTIEQVLTEDKRREAEGIAR